MDVLVKERDVDRIPPYFATGTHHSTMVMILLVVPLGTSRQFFYPQQQNLMMRLYQKQNSTLGWLRMCATLI